MSTAFGYYQGGVTAFSTGPTTVLRWERKRESHDTRTYAPHLRGKVYRAHVGWRFEVVNEDTGRIVSRDDGHGDLEHAFKDAEFATAVARAAWMRGLTAKSLRRDLSGRAAS